MLAIYIVLIGMCFPADHMRYTLFFRPQNDKYKLNVINFLSQEKKKKWKRA